MVSQLRPTLTPSSTPCWSSLRMKLVLRPLILEASVTEIRCEVRSLSGGIFRVSYQEQRWVYENGKERDRAAIIHAPDGRTKRTRKDRALTTCGLRSLGSNEWWLWEGRLRIGKAERISGYVPKRSRTYDLAARVSRGIERVHSGLVIWRSAFHPNP